MTSSAPSRRRRQSAGVDFALPPWPQLALAGAVVASGLLIYHLTRGSSFSVDDWIWIETRRGSSLGTLLAPYNGHLSLVPIAIYRVMFAAFGIGSFTPYRALLVVIASVTGVVIFDYARRRVGELGALPVAVLLLFLGPGWNDLLQPFQIAWLLAVASGILALSLLDRRRTWTDAAACLLILISISSTSVGVALTIGIAVDIAISRRRWREAWIVGLPLLLYVVWAIHYHPSAIQSSAITSAPLNLAQTTAAALAGLVGLSGVTPTDLTGSSLAFGVPLLALVVAAVSVRSRTDWDAIRFFSLGAALVTFSILTSLARSFQSPFESRYMYVTCVLSALMVLELVRGLVIPLRAQLAIIVLSLIAVASNINVLRSGGGYFRQLGALTDATLGAVQLDRGRVAADTSIPLYPLGATTGGQYFAAARALGTPAYTVAALTQATPAAQGAADAQFLVDRDVEFAGAAARSPTSGSPPSIEAEAGGSAVRRGACAEFRPTAALVPGAASALTLELGPGRVSVSTGVAPATISVRRFATAFTQLGKVQAPGSAIVSVSRNPAPQPWHLQVQSAAPMRVCTVSGP